MPSGLQFDFSKASLSLILSAHVGDVPVMPLRWGELLQPPRFMAGTSLAINSSKTSVAFQQGCSLFHCGSAPAPQRNVSRHDTNSLLQFPAPSDSLASDSLIQVWFRRAPHLRRPVSLLVIQPLITALRLRNDVS